LPEHEYEQGFPGHHGKEMIHLDAVLQTHPNVSSLTSRERYVLECRAKGHFLHTIAVTNEISRERVRQIERAGLAKLGISYEKDALCVPRLPCLGEWENGSSIPDNTVKK
jgi:DNA-binding CsgD family transcriptional regulator